MDLRQAIRKYLIEIFGNKTHDWEEEKKVPPEMYKKVCDAGLMTLAMGTPWPTEFYPQ